MFDHLRALFATAVGDDRSTAARVVLLTLTSIIGDFLIVYAVLDGLALRRIGEASARPLLLFIVGVVAFASATSKAQGELDERLSTAARATINRIVRRLPRLPLLRYEQLERGVIVTRILGDGNQVATSGQVVLRVPNGFLRLLIGGAFASTISPAAALLLFGGVLLVAAAAAAQLRAQREDFDDLAGFDARLYALLRTKLEGSVALRLHRPRAAALARAFAEISERVRALREQLFERAYQWELAGDALVYGLLGFNVFVLPLVAEVSTQDTRALNLLTLWLVLAAVKIVVGLPRLSASGTALARLQELELRLADDELEPAPSAHDAGDEPSRFATFERIEVRGLCFRYPASRHRASVPIGPLDLELRRGELVFITGHNGSGKSTFGRLLCGLYPPHAGAVLVDGVPIDDTNLVAWRTAFAAIFTNHHVFERAYGVDASAAARAPALLERLELAHKTSIVDGRVTTRELSTGQRQRLALALLLLDDKPIVLLDEWAADQDPEFRALFYDELLPALRDEGRLVVVITHDDNYFDRADRCIRFERGKIIEAVS